MRIILFFFLFFPLLAFGQVEILEVNGKTITFRAVDYVIPFKKRVLILSKKKTKKGKPRKLALARVVSLEGKIYTARIIKKYRKKEKVVEGLKVRISKKYRLKTAGKSSDKKNKKGSKNGKSSALDFVLKTRPLVFVTGYFDAEAEFALKGSSKSFSLAFAYLGLEEGTNILEGFGGVGKYNKYFADRAIDQGLYMSGSFGLFLLNASGFASNGSLINVDLYVPFLGGGVGYQFIFSKKFTLNLGIGAGYYLISNEVDVSAITGVDATLEVPLSGFTPTIDLAFGYSF